MLHCEGDDFESTSEDDMGEPLEDAYFSKGMKNFALSDGFMLYGKLGVGFSQLIALVYKQES